MSILAFVLAHVLSILSAAHIHGVVHPDLDTPRVGCTSGTSCH